MKRNITIVVSIFLIFMFLVYSGVFMDFSKPVTVVRYYFDCLKNREGFLTYHISKPEFFDEDKLGNIYQRYNLRNAKKTVFNLKEMSNNYAIVQAIINYKSEIPAYLLIKLEKNDNNWLINSIGFERSGLRDERKE